MKPIKVATLLFCINLATPVMAESIIRNGIDSGPASKQGWSEQQAHQAHKAFSLDTHAVATNTHERYVWTHPEEFFPTAGIKRLGSISQLQYAPDNRLASHPILLGDKKTTLAEYVSEDPGVDAVLIAYKGKIVFEAYPRMNPTDNHVWWSVGKVTTGVGLALLEQEGRVELDKEVETYLPWLKGTAWEGTSVRSINDMSSGINADENANTYVSKDSNWYLWGAAMGIRAPGVENTNKNTDQIIAEFERKEPAGHSYNYTTVDTYVAQRVIEAVTGQRFNDFMSNNFWKHIGAEADAQIAINREGVGASGSTISSRPVDLLRFGMLFTPSWEQVSQKQIFERETIQRMQKSGVAARFNTGDTGRYYSELIQKDGLTNAYQWDYITPEGDMYKAGFGGQGLYVSPDKDLVIVTLATGSLNSWELPVRLVETGLFN